MKNRKAFVTIILLFVVPLLIGGAVIIYFFGSGGIQENKSKDEMTMSGTVASLDGSRVLVVDGVSDGEIEANSVEEIISLSTDAAWFSAPPEMLDTIEMLDHAKVRYAKMDDSYPGQGEATGIEKVSN